MKIRPVGAELFHAYGWLDGQTASHDEANHRSFSFFRTRLKIHLLPCGHKHDVPPCSKRFTTTAVQFCGRCSCSIFQVVQRYRHWQNVNPIFHKALQKKVQGVRHGDRGRGVWTFSAEPSFRQLPVQHGCNLGVDLWWRFVLFCQCL